MERPSLAIVNLELQSPKAIGQDLIVKEPLPATGKKDQTVEADIPEDLSNVFEASVKTGVNTLRES